LGSVVFNFSERRH